MSAKRALIFDAPSAKKRRTMTPRPRTLVRVSKPEMKHISFLLSHTATTGANLDITAIPQGSDVNERIGNKIKIWRISGVVNCTVPTLAHLIMPYDASTTPTNTYSAATVVNDNMYFNTYCLNPHTTANANCFEINHKFPMGLVTRYGDGTATDIVKNKLVFQTNCPTTATVNGFIRVWYTDV